MDATAGSELIGAASAEFERAVQALPADSWERGTPCDMSVRAVVDHVVQGNRFTALILGGVGREEAFAVVSGDQLGSDPLAAVRSSVRAQADAFSESPPDQSVPGPRGLPVTAEEFLRFRLVDLVVHAWDVRRGAGVDETLDPDVVTRLSELVEPHLDWMLGYGAYGDGPSGALGPDAPAQARLLDWFGRRPD